MSSVRLREARADVIGSPNGRTYQGAELRHLRFPLGGIGTGSISIDGAGRLRDFEIFNRPAKGLNFDETFFSLWTRSANGRMETRALQGPLGDEGLAADARAEVMRRTGAGLPHMRHVQFTGRFPLAQIDFDEVSLPVQVRLEAVSPFIPLAADESSLPAAMFNFTLTNPTDQPIEVCLYARLENKLGFPDVGGGLIERVDGNGLRGVRMTTNRHPVDSPQFGSLALVTPHPTVRVQTHGHRGRWFDALQHFWDEVSQDRFQQVGEPAERESGTDVATIGLSATVAAGDSVVLPIWLTWHIPNFVKYWGPITGSGSADGLGATWLNHYAVRFPDALAVAEHLAQHGSRLISQTREFADALWSTTLPAPVMDAITANLATLRTPTTVRLSDGTFYGWEGCDNSEGSCEGTCNHVWNYAQALPYLFPDLERSVREAEYRVNLHDDGHMTFRMPLPVGTRPAENFHAAADGQLGGVLRTYREWLIGGDDDWLRAIWPGARRSLEYAWLAWDIDRDGVPEGLQHNTFDIEFFGPNPLVAILYLAALRAAARMAERVGESEFGLTCLALAERGQRWIDSNLFNGEYFIQQVEPDADRGAPFPPTYARGQDRQPPYQHGLGCLSDQLLGQWYAHMLGLGHVIDPDHAHAAVASIFRYNWKSELWDHANAQRIFALEDEGGLLLATWPHGGRPTFPFPYSDEVWTGVEYEVAALLIYEGLTADALRIVETARERYDGRRRNPWCEIECGNHYARAMSSYGLLLAFGGFRYEAPDRRLVFRPADQTEPDFSMFFSVGSGWGVLRRSASPSGSGSGSGSGTISVQVQSGVLELAELATDLAVDQVEVRLGDQLVAARVERSVDGAIVRLDQSVSVRPGRNLSVRT